MHEHIQVSHEKDSCVKRLIHMLKESSACSALKTGKKTLNDTSLKILICTYGIDF